MSMQTWQETIVSGATDGPTLTAASANSCIPTANKITLPNNFFYIGRVIAFRLSGRISCVVTTPGTARFDIRMGAAGSTVVYDSGALNLNIVAKTTVPWYFECRLVCRAVGNSTSTTFFPHGASFQSEAVVGAPANTAGGNGSLLAPVGAPAVGGGMDNTAASIIDVFFTQTVATGSLTVHCYQIDILN